MRSCLRSKGPKRSITVKHYQSIVYMNFGYTRPGPYAAEQRRPREQDRVGPLNRNRGERDEDNPVHEIRTIPPTQQIPTNPTHQIRATATDDDGAT